MKAVELYKQLEKDFVRPGIAENWSVFGMSEAGDYICDNFRRRGMGLLCDFAKEINRVYTAVFPSEKILSKILDDGATDAMLFLHHPLIWDLSKDPDTAFYQMNPELLKELKKKRVSLFNFHFPLDNFSEYSTSKTLAERLGLAIEKPFAEVSAALCGVIGKTDCSDVHELNARYSQVVGHRTKLYQYGKSRIIDGRVAVAAGGGNDVGVINEMIENGINVLVSGLSLINKYSSEAHDLEKENNINLIGGTHYSSEKFACIEMCKYFGERGLQSEFIHDDPCFEDL